MRCLKFSLAPFSFSFPFPFLFTSLHINYLLATVSIIHAYIVTSLSPLSLQTQHRPTRAPSSRFGALQKVCRVFLGIGASVGASDENRPRPPTTLLPG